MADLATIGFRADTRDLRRAEQELNRLSTRGLQTDRTVNRLAASSRSLAMRMTRLAASIGLVVSAGAAIRGTVRTIAEFEASMSKVQAITRATEIEMRQLENTARQLGASTEFSAVQAADALSFLGMAGFSAAQSMQAIPDVLNLATAAGIELARAADIASNVLSGFGMTTAQTSRVTDVLAATASRANTSVDQLGDAMAFAGPVAAALGIDIGDAAAAIGVLSDAGLQGGMAGTGLRRVMSSLANPTKAARDVIESLGLSINQLNPETNDLVDIIERLSQSGLSAADALTIFGDRGGPAILALTGNVGRLRDLTETMQDVTGESATMAEIMRDNLQGAVANMRSAMSELALTLKDTLTPALTTAANLTTDLLRGVSSLLSGEDTLLSDALLQTRVRVRGIQEALDATVKSMDGYTISIRRMQAAGADEAAIAGLQSILERQLREFTRLQEELRKAKIDEEVAMLELALKRYNEELERLQAAGANYYELKQQTDLIAAAKARIEELTPETQKTTAAIEDMERAVESVNDKTSEYRNSLSNLAQSMTDQVAMFDMSETAALEYRLTVGDLSEAVKALGDEGYRYMEQIIAQANELEMLNKVKREQLEIEREQRSLTAQLTSSVEQLRRRLNPLMASYEDWIRNEKLLEDALKAGIINVTEYEQLIDQLARTMDTASRETEKLEKETSVFATAVENAIRRLDDSFANIWSSAFDGFSDMRRAITTSFRQMLAELANAAITRPILLSIGSAITGGSSGQAGQTGQETQTQSIVGAIRTSISALNTDIVGSIKRLGVTIAGESTGLRASIGGFLQTYSTQIANALPFAGAAFSLVQGNIRGAAFQGAGAAVGTLLGGPVGGIVGSTVGGLIGGLFGGSGERFRQVESLRRGTLSGDQFTTSASISRRTTSGMNNAIDAIQESFSRNLFALLDSFDIGRDITTAVYTRLRRTSGDLIAEFYSNVLGGAGQFRFRVSGNIGSGLEQFANQVTGSILAQAIRGSALPQGIRDLFAGFTQPQEVADLINATISLNQAADGLNERFGLTVSQAAQVARGLGHTGQALIDFVNNFAEFGRGFANVGSQLISLRDGLADAYGRELPASIDAFDQALKGINTTTAAGIRSFTAMFELRDAFVQYQSAIDEISAGVSSALFTILTPAEQLEQMQSNLTALFNEFDLVVPKTTRELIDMGKAIDMTSEEGINLAMVFPSLVEAFRLTEEKAESLKDVMESINRIDASRFSNVVEFRRAVALSNNQIPGFASGGVHSGGLRIVGERGPEVEATGPSRIFNQSQLINLEPMLNEMKMLRRDVEEMRIDSREINRHTRVTADIVERVSRDGEAFIVTEAVA